MFPKIHGSSCRLGTRKMSKKNVFPDVLGWFASLRIAPGAGNYVTRTADPFSFYTYPYPAFQILGIRYWSVLSKWNISMMFSWNSIIFFRNTDPDQASRWIRIWSESYLGSATMISTVTYLYLQCLPPSSAATQQLIRLFGYRMFATKVRW